MPASYANLPGRYKAVPDRPMTKKVNEINELVKPKIRGRADDGLDRLSGKVKCHQHLARAK